MQEFKETKREKISIKQKADSVKRPIKQQYANQDN